MFLSNLVLAVDYDLVFIVETWMSSIRRDALVVPPGYNIVRKDRTHKKGGGILVLYKSCHTVIDVLNEVSETVEYICLDLLIPAHKKQLRFMCVYCPPDLSRRTTYVKDLTDCIKVCKKNCKEFYLLGDFNMPAINWKSLRSTTKAGEMFLDFCVETGLSQYVQEPTHKSGSVLDLLLCEEPCHKHVSSICIRPPLMQRVTIM